MRLTKLPNGFNWKYAIGEIALIVVGITIALAANSWYEGRKDRQDEMVLLQQMQLTLQEDLEELSRRSITMQQVEQDIAALLSHLEEDRPYSDDLGGYLRSLSRFRGTRMRLAPFEALKARGLELISSDSLRMQMISLYEDEFPGLEVASNFNRIFAQEKVTPYLMTNFRQVESREWVPYDYERIKSEGYLANLCRNRLSSLRDFVLPNYEDTTVTIREVLVAIEQELDK
jgi:hypothetical protein